MRRLIFALLLVSLLSISARAENGWSGGGPDGGWVISFLTPFGPEGMLFAGTYGGGVWRSDDHGETWFSVSENAADAIVWDLEFAADVNGTLYAGTEDRTVLKQQLGTRTWGTASRGLSDPAPVVAWGIDVNPVDPALLSLASSDGVFHSRDRGGSWPDSLGWAIGVPITDVEVPLAAPNTTYALGFSSLFVSPNRGATFDEWTEGLPPSLYLYDLELWPGPEGAPAQSDRMIVADFTGKVWQVRDEEFVSIGPSPVVGQPRPRFYRARVLGESEPTIWVAADHGLYRTDDVGDQWGRIDGGIQVEKPEIWSLTPDDPVAESFWLGSFRYGVMHTGPGATNWRPRNRGLQASWVRSLDAWDQNVLAGTAHGGVHLSRNEGETWRDISGDLDLLQILGVHKVRGRNRYLAAGSTSVKRSDDGGTHWVDVNLGPTRTPAYRFLQTAAMGDDEILLGTFDGLRFSGDGGTNFKPLRGLESVDDPVLALAMAADSTFVFASESFTFAGDRALYVGKWGTEEYERLDLPSPFSRRVRGLAFVGQQSDQLVVAMASDNNRPARLLRIDNFRDPATRVFVPLDANVEATVREASDLVSDARGNLYLSFSSEGVFHSPDAGQTWTNSSAGLQSPRVEELVLRKGMAPRLYAATLARGVFGRDVETGVSVLLSGPDLEVVAEGILTRMEVGVRSEVEVWRSINGGMAQLWWSAEASGAVERLDAGLDLFAPSSRRVEYEVRLIQDGRELLRQSTWLELPLANAPVQTRLLPNRPNPFNPRTTLVMEIAEAGPLELDVYDARGRRVRRLFAEEAPAGRHEFSWDGRDERGAELASGIYLVRARTAGQSHVQRVTLVR